MEKIRIEDYNKLNEIHDKIVQLLEENHISIYNGIGLLETIKQEIFIQELDNEKND